MLGVMSTRGEPGEATLADLLALPEQGHGYEIIEGSSRSRRRVVS